MVKGSLGLSEWEDASFEPISEVPASSVVFSGLASIFTAAGACFLDSHFLEQGELGMDAIPEPFGDHFAGGVFEAVDLIEEVMIELKAEGFEDFGDVAVVDEVTTIFGNFAGDDDFSAEGVAVHATTLVPFGKRGEEVGGFEGE